MERYSRLRSGCRIYIEITCKKAPRFICLLRVYRAYRAYVQVWHAHINIAMLALTAEITRYIRVSPPVEQNYIIGMHKVRS